MSLTRLSLAALILAAALNASSATFTVTSSNDSGPGTLRQAILDANAAPGADQIVFAEENVFLDTPALPEVTGQVDILGPAVITIVNAIDGSGPFTFAAGSSGSDLGDIRITGAARITINAGVTGVQVYGMPCELCVVTIHGDQNLVADSHILSVTVFGDRNGIYSSWVERVEIDSGSGNIVGGPPTTSNYLRFLRLRSASDTSVSFNSFTASSLFPDAIEVSNGPVPATSGITINQNHFTGYTGAAVNVLTGTPVSPTGVEIFSNTFVGIPTPIDLGDDGATANDPAPDADGGPNNLQNYPVLTSAVLASGSFTVGGTLTSAPLTQYRINLYRGSGSGAERSIGSFDSFLVTTDAAGVATFTHTLTSFPSSADTVLATATNQLTRDTSEIGGAVAIASHLDVPTVSQWGLMILAAALAAITLSRIGR